MPVEQLTTPAQETELDRALHVIRTDNTLFPINFGPNGQTATKSDIYEKLFGKEAKLGYYRNFPSLSVDKINSVLEEGIIKLANAKVVIHIPSVIDGELKKAKNRM